MSRHIHLHVDKIVADRLLLRAPTGDSWDDWNAKHKKHADLHKRHAANHAIMGAGPKKDSHKQAAGNHERAASFYKEAAEHHKAGKHDEAKKAAKEAESHAHAAKEYEEVAPLPKKTEAKPLNAEQRLLHHVVKKAKDASPNITVSVEHPEPKKKAKAGAQSGTGETGGAAEATAAGAAEAVGSGAPLRPRLMGARSVEVLNRIDEHVRGEKWDELTKMDFAGAHPLCSKYRDELVEFEQKRAPKPKAKK